MKFWGKSPCYNFGGARKLIGKSPSKKYEYYKNYKIIFLKKKVPFYN